MSQDRTPVDLPARKLRVADLASLQQRGDSWHYTRSDGSFSAGLVWLQGEVTSVAPDKKEVVLSDDGAEVTVTNCDAVPGGTGWLTRGLYVMAVGVVEESGHQPRMAAIKLSDLTTNPVHCSTWPWEVQELKRLLVTNPDIAEL